MNSARKLVGLRKPPPPPPRYQEPYDVPTTNGDGHGYGQPWVEETEPYSYHDQAGPPQSRLRGGADREYEEGDEAAFTARPVRAPYPDLSNPNNQANTDDFRPKAFHRTPTGLSTKQRKRAEDFTVDLEGGLDVCINVEVNARDPAGITVPYRLLVPRLFHDEEDEKRHDELLAAEVPGKGFKRFLSFKRKGSAGRPPPVQSEPEPELQPQCETEPGSYEPSAEVSREEFGGYPERQMPLSHPRQQYAPRPEIHDSPTPPRVRQQYAPIEYHNSRVPQPRQREQHAPGPDYYSVGRWE